MSLGKIKKKKKKKKKKKMEFFTLIGAISDHVGLGIALSTYQSMMIVLVVWV